MKAGQIYVHAPANVLSGVIALRVHIDHSREDNGPLRVLPDTHTLGRIQEQRIAQMAQERPSEHCLVDSGGVVAMRPLTIHASSKSRSVMPRRVLHIEYACNLDLGNGLTIAVA